MNYEEDNRRREAARQRLRARQERSGRSPANEPPEQQRSSRREVVDARSDRHASSNEKRGRGRGAQPSTSPAQGAFGPLAQPIANWKKKSLPVKPIALGVAVLVLIIVIALIARSCASHDVQDASATNTGQAATSSASVASGEESNASAGATSSNEASSASADEGSPASYASTADAQSAASVAAAIASANTPVEAIIAAVPEIDRTPIDEDSLANLMGWELTNKLLDRAKTNNDAHWIASHPEEYLEDGSMVQFKLLRLAANEGEAIPFVRAWPQTYCADAPDYSAPHADRESNGVPHLLQWDQRWGYTEYSGTTFALTGCCPTTMAMIYQGVTGKTDKTPYDMGVLASEDGYMSALDGTAAEFLTGEAATLGMTCTPIDVTQSALEQALKQGMVVAANVGAGDFTDGGHYFVITGLSSNGELEINDPFSVERSERTWPIATVLNQTMSLYGFSK